MKCQLFSNAAEKFLKNNIVHIAYALKLFINFNKSIVKSL